MSHESELMESATKGLSEAETPADKLQLYSLSHGYNGILRLGRIFRCLDNDGSMRLNKDEMVESLKNFFPDFSDDDVAQLFESVDTDDDGNVNYEEFLDAIRPPMNDERKEVVGEAFAKLDESATGVVTIDDIKGKYDASNHPKVLSGEQTTDDVLLRFLSRFEGSTSQDGMVTKAEFFDYYSGISNSIDEDEYFIEVIRKCWQL